MSYPLTIKRIDIALKVVESLKLQNVKQTKEWPKVFLLYMLACIVNTCPKKAFQMKLKICGRLLITNRWINRPMIAENDHLLVVRDKENISMRI